MSHLDLDEATIGSVLGQVSVFPTDQPNSSRFGYSLAYTSAQRSARDCR